MATQSEYHFRCAACGALIISAVAVGKCKKCGSQFKIERGTK